MAGKRKTRASSKAEEADVSLSSLPSSPPKPPLKKKRATIENTPEDVAFFEGGAVDSNAAENTAQTRYSSAENTLPQSDDRPLIAPAISDELYETVDDGTEPITSDEYDQSIYRPTAKQRVEIFDKFNAKSFDNGPDYSLPPINKLPEIFEDLVKKATENFPDFHMAVKHLERRKLRVATICSGTESPVTALKMIFQCLGTENKLTCSLQYEHLFSVEIVPFKQAFIELNFSPKLLFRDIIEMAQSQDGKATTAFGSRKHIPHDIDLAIIGFSCVDMSNLNRNKVGLHEMGESGDTLQASIELAKRLDIRVLILENVKGAPWTPSAKVPKGLSISEQMFTAGYYSQSISMDTKDFYLPHTRVRGYMVCVSMKWVTSNPFNPKCPEAKEFMPLKKTEQPFLVAVRKLERPASSPVEAFMLSETDGRVSRADSESGAAIRLVNWGTCEAAHASYRSVNGLGTDKPLTQWTLGGACKPHDVLRPEWVHNTVERIRDSLEIMFLRNLRRGFDPIYKNRMIDLSQNIDRRSIDTGASGYTGCITPTGLPYSTVRGRLLIAEEALNLQGMNPDTLNVSQLTQRQLRDLAGNAMSCPTVGAAILAALSLTYEAFPQTGVDEQVQEVLSADRIVELEVERPIFDIVFGPIVKELPKGFLAMVKQSLRHCSCEGQFGFPTANLLQCSHCNFKACVEHSANPEHSYTTVSLSRINPGTLMSKLGQLLPMSVGFEINDLSSVLEKMKEAFIKFLGAHVSQTIHKESQKEVAPKKGKNSSEANITTNSAKNQVSPDDPANQSHHPWPLLKAILKESQGSDIHFKSIDRTAYYLKCYFESQDSAVGALRLELILSPESIEWNLFLESPKAQPVNSPLRAMLDQPIARMRPDVEKRSIMAGQWELRLPELHFFDITIQGAGECEKCYQFRKGIRSFKNVTIWSELDVIVHDRSSTINGYDISGKYVLYTNCGGPEGVLYKKECPKVGEKPVFIFLNVSRYGRPDKDSFVFAPEIYPRLRFGEIPSIIARLDNVWRPISGPQDWSDRPFEESSPGSDSYEILGKDYIYQPAPAGMPLKVRCSIEHTWCSLDARLMTKAKGVYSHISKFADLAEVFSKDHQDHCYDSIEILDVKVSAANLGIEESQAGVLAAKDCPEFLSKLTWISKRIPIDEGHGNSSDQWHKVSMSMSSQECHICAAPLPDVKWKLQQTKWTAAEIREAKKTKYKSIPDAKSKDFQLVPYEDPEGSIYYERAVKARPSPFVVQYQMDHQKNLHVKIGANVKTLIHRAAASLPKADARRSRPVEVAYRFMTDYDEFARASLKPFTIPDNTGDPLAPKPPLFALDLFAHQARSLNWMIAQEDTDTHFKEERVVEAYLKEFNWRCEGRATREVSVRGGILADQVGYGKTACTFGLIASQASKQPIPAATSLNGYIQIKATIILVPNHLVGQWVTERKKFMKPDCGWKILVIKNTQEWQNSRISDFIEANVIICPWTLLDDKAYLKRVAQLSGMLGYPEDGTIRATETWYSACRDNLRLFANEIVFGDRTTMSNRLEDEHVRNWEEAQTNSANKPSFRLRGAARRAQKGKDKLANKAGEKNITGKEPSNEEEARKAYRKHSPNVISLKDGQPWQDLRGPPLELFEFYRKVVDEYTYLKGQESETIAHLNSKCSWFLSGTPGLNDYVDAWRLMKLLGVDLGQPELTRGIISPQNIKLLASQWTETEAFRALLHERSFAWSMSRHGYAQEAIEKFVRQNITPIEKFPVYRHIVPVELSAIDRAIYSELAISVAASDMREKKPLNIFKGLDRQDKITKIFEKINAAGGGSVAHSAIEALMKCNFAHTELEIHNTLSERTKKLVEIRDTLDRSLRAAQYRRAHDPANLRYYDDFCARIQGNELGDRDATRYLMRLISDREAIPDDLKDEDPEAFRIANVDPMAPKSMLTLRVLSNKLRDLSKKLVAAWRGSRFIESTEALRRRALYPKSAESDYIPLELMGCCSKAVDKGKHTPCAVFAECGHLFCESCIQENRENGINRCTKAFCSPPGGFSYLMYQEEFSKDTVPNGANAKLTAIAELIKRIDKKDQVLLFTQFADQNSAVAKVLEDHRISFDMLDTAKETQVSPMLLAFREKYNPKFQRKGSGKQVLVLNINNVSAAGSNLTCANHVIFAMPYLAPTQTKFNSSMTQAIGRVQRHGQQKPIHLYFFLALNTADVDVFEARYNSVLVKDDALQDQTYDRRAVSAEINEWDDSSHAPNIKEWIPSGLRLVKPESLPLNETRGKYSSAICDKVIHCINGSLEDGENDDSDQDNQGDDFEE